MESLGAALLIVAAAYWLLSPIGLPIWLVIQNSKTKRMQMKLYRLFEEGKITGEDYYEATGDLPPVLPAGAMPPVSVSESVAAQQPTVPVSAETAETPKPAQPVQTDVSASTPHSVSPTPQAAPNVAPQPAAMPMPSTTPASAAQPKPPYAPPIPPVRPIPPRPGQPLIVVNGERTASEFVKPPKPKRRFSAISAMLFVGVVFVVISGMLFVRYTWSDMTAGGRLATLLAGSVLFFGVSVLAHRVFKLERTSMAFYTMGAAFLPISLWAAGYFNLLGERLSGADNAWLLVLSAGAFTILSLLAVFLYRQVAWGVSTLIAMTLTWLFFLGTDWFTLNRVTIALTGYVLLFGYGAPFVQKLLPNALGRVIVPYAMVQGFVLLPLYLATTSEADVFWYGLGAVLYAMLFLAPTYTARMKAWSALPMGAILMYGMHFLFIPLTESYRFQMSVGQFESLIGILGAMICLVLVLSEVLPKHTVPGYRIAYHAFSLYGMVFLWIGMQSKQTEPWLTLVAMAILTAATILPALQGDGLMRAWLALESIFLCYNIGMLLPPLEPMRYLVLIGLLLVCGIVFFRWERLRTLCSDFAFPIAMTICGMAIIEHAGFLGESETGLMIAAQIILWLLPLYWWYLAMEREQVSANRIVKALFIVPALLIAGVKTNTWLWEIEHTLVTAEQLWCFGTLVLGLLTILTIRDSFHLVRKMAAGVTLIPALVYGLGASLFATGKQELWSVWAVVLSAWLLYWLSTRSRWQNLSTPLCCTAALAMTVCGTQYALRELVWETAGFHTWMLATIWLLLFGILGILVQRGMLSFRGGEALQTVTAIALPYVALFLAWSMYDVNPKDWYLFFGLYGILFSTVAWWTSGTQERLQPTVSCAALIFTLDVLRVRLDLEQNTAVAGLTACMGLLMVLFCYLGIFCCRSGQKRGWSLTYAGGVVPIWMYAVSGEYTAKQADWMAFFAVILGAGYLLHLLHIPNIRERHSKLIITIAGALVVIACWGQPLWNVSDTYWEGKLHLLPLVAYGVLLRWLFGPKKGSLLLFGTGVYSVLVLGIQAINSGKTADLITILFCGLGIFVVSFYIKQRKWFLLGGATLLGIVVYIRMKAFPDVPWWVFLLLVGIVLIVIGATNEIYKQRGESLKEKAGRLWEDWEW